MTEERKKYLDEISKEEWIIRLNIIGLKARIRDEKFWLNHVTGDTEKQIEQTLWRINSTKIIIKALKKQLPVPKRIIPQVFNLNLKVYDCQICGDRLSYGSECYCASCGQKFR